MHIYIDANFFEELQGHCDNFPNHTPPHAHTTPILIDFGLVHALHLNYVCKLEYVNSTHKPASLGIMMIDIDSSCEKVKVMVLKVVLEYDW